MRRCFFEVPVAPGLCYFSLEMGNFTPVDVDLWSMHSFTGLVSMMTLKDETMRNLRKCEIMANTFEGR